MIDNDKLEKLCRKLYELNRRYKIEYDDLYQQAWVIMLENNVQMPEEQELKHIEKCLYKYISTERKNPLSDAISMEELYSKHKIENF